MASELQPETSYSAIGGSALDYARALLNILEDSASEQDQLRDTQSAALNILEDSAFEQSQLRGTQRAALNILEDFGIERNRLEGIERAILNILEDLAVEKNRLEESRREVIQSAEALRSSLGEKETLLKEIHHRVKNNLQVIASLLRLQSRYLGDEQVRVMFQESQNRVHSISLVHEMLYQTGDLARVDFCDYLTALSRGLVEGWKGAAGAIDVTVRAEGIQLGVDVAVPCGLIVNELVTNALKHAFPDGRSGTVQVEVRRDPAGWLKLRIQDKGIGMPEKPDLRRAGSLGLELVGTLVRQLRGKVEIQRYPGTAFEISFQVQ